MKFKITKINKIILTQEIEANNDYQAKSIASGLKNNWSVEPSEEELIVEEVK